MLLTLKNLVSEFKAMPLILKFLTAHALVSFIFFVAAVIPGIPFNFNGKEMSFSELWSSGIGIFTVYVGLTMPFCGFLMLKRKAYSRLIYLFILSSVLIAPYIYWKEAVGLSFGVITTLLIAGYIYGKPSVREYFASNS